MIRPGVHSSRWWLPVLLLALLVTQSLASKVTGTASDLEGKCFGSNAENTQHYNASYYISTREGCQEPFRVKLHLKTKRDVPVFNKSYALVSFNPDFGTALKGVDPQVNYTIGTCSFSLNVTKGEDDKGQKLFTVPELGFLGKTSVNNATLVLCEKSILIDKNGDLSTWDALCNGTIPIEKHGDPSTFAFMKCSPFDGIIDDGKLTVEQTVKDGTQPGMLLRVEKASYIVDWVSADYPEKPTTPPPTTEKPVITEEPANEPSEDEENATPTTEPAGSPGVIIGAICGGLLLLVVIVVIVIVVRRRRNKPAAVQLEGDPYEQPTEMTKIEVESSRLGSGLIAVEDGPSTGAAASAP